MAAGWTVTHIAELLVDFASLDVHLHVRQTDPLVQIFTVVDATDAGLGAAGRQDLQHVRGDVVLGFCFLIVLLVQTLRGHRRSYECITSCIG